MHGGHQPVQRVEAARLERQRAGQRAHDVARLRQHGVALEQPRRRIAVGIADDAGPVLRLDDAGRDDDDLRLRAAIVPHEIDAVAEAVGVGQRRLGAVDRDLPGAHRLAGPRLRVQPQALQRVRRPLVELVTRDVSDRESHGKPQSKLYASAMSTPRLLLRPMKSVRNSCSPLLKIRSTDVSDNICRIFAAVS